MSAQVAQVTRQWQAGAYRCTLTVQLPGPGGQAACSIEWEPAKPTKLTGAALQEYRRGRDQAFAEISGELGLSVAIVELP
jgi:hypothetical protein